MAKTKKRTFSKEIEILITLLQNVSNSGVGGGDSDGSVGEGCGEGCGPSCRGGHGVGVDDVGGDGVVVVVVVVVMVLVSEKYK